MLDLQGKMNVFLKQKYEKLQAESDTFAKATSYGQNKKKVRELAGAIRKRLDAAPVPPTSTTESPAVPSVPPNPTGTALPSLSPK
jgi:hypothetical protein